MTRRDRVLVEHREAILAAAGANRATSIALVGSVARGDDGPDSDYDFVATFEPGATVFDIGGLLADLEDLLGGEVDVLDAAGLKARRAEVLAEAIPL